MRPFEPVIQPALPFVDSLQLQPGSIVTIDGFIPGNSNDFQINFALGPVADRNNPSSIAFHFNPRFSENEVVRNAYSESAGWGHEERGGGMSLMKEQPFQIMFLIEPQEYKVAVNGQHFCAFQHRVPFHVVTHLQVAGDVQIDKLQLHSAAPTGPAPVQLPALPFEYPIPNWLAPGRTITILGRPKPSADRFNVDLFDNQTGDILFHFNPRYPEQTIVRNSCIGGDWGQEERETPFFNIMAGNPFSLKIVCEPDFYSVYTNDQHFCYFQHRIPFNLVNHIRIIGDVDIDNITFT